VPVRAAAAVGKAIEAAILVAFEDLIARLAGDIELAADDGHFFAVEQAGDEAETLIHLGTLLPGHLRLPQSPEVLPMSPVRSGIYVSISTQRLALGQAVFVSAARRVCRR